MLRDDGDCGDECKKNEQRNNAGKLARLRSGGIAIKKAVERIDQRTRPAHRMADGAKQPFRVTETEFDQHGDEGKRDRHDLH